MENFLNFLSNNYLYFLIAAGVLLFALIGFLADLKKKNKEEDIVEETPVPEVESYETTPVTPIPEVLAEPVETLNPAPPMPTTESIEIPVESVPTPEVEPIMNPTSSMNVNEQVEQLNVEETK